MQRPLILVCNDDGITAPGIRALVEAVQDLGDVVIVAPDSPQSGMGHAVTIGEPLRLNMVEGLFPAHQKAFQTSGTPVDCVKLAVDKVLHRRPNLLVSGINHGANSSVNILYSGTMSAAMEGAIEGIPSVGFSLCDFSHYANFDIAKLVAKQIASEILNKGLPNNTLLNVNIPKVDRNSFKGIKFCRQASARWTENFDERTDPHGKKYYWLKGDFTILEHATDTDEWALAQGFASAVPVQFDLTAYRAFPHFENWLTHVETQ